MQDFRLLSRNLRERPASLLILLFAVVLAVLCAVPGPVFSAEDTVTRAMKLYEKRHYNEASRVLRSGIKTVGPDKEGPANLAMGLICFKNALLHQSLHRLSLLASRDYLKKLSSARGRDRSRFVDLYLGEALLEAGTPGVAAIYLKKFSDTSRTDARSRSIASVLLGLCYHLNKEPARARELWRKIGGSDPEVMAELAAAYSKAGIENGRATALIKETFDTLNGSRGSITARMVKNLLILYNSNNEVEQGLALLEKADLNVYSFRESIGKSKVIQFYDPALLGEMAELYGRASMAYFERAESDPKTADAAKFNLVQAQSIFGSAGQGATTAALLLASARLPQQYQDRTRVWQAADFYRENRKAEAVAQWEGLSGKQPADPDLLGEILFTCSRLKLECNNAVRTSAGAAERGEGRRYANLNSSIGHYYLHRLDFAKAVLFLEAGRDKSNKNKIEVNDPILLVDLAEAYYRTKKFPEALEIFFEMGKQFPEVRQIQEATQGVYAFEHKSAGDVKIN